MTISFHIHTLYIYIYIYALYIYNLNLSFHLTYLYLSNINLTNCDYSLSILPINKYILIYLISYIHPHRRFYPYYIYSISIP